MRWSVAGSLALAAFLGTACHSMTPVSWDDVAALRPTQVWVTRADRSTVQVSGPQVFGDTLVGYVGGAFQEIATVDVARVAIRRSNKTKTLALVAASIAGAAAVGIIISSVGEPAPNQYLDCADVPDDPRCQGQGP